jgi:hypothetical protein
VAAVVFGTGLAGVQNFGISHADPYFRLEWQVGADKRGRTTVSGYIYNERGLRATNVSLLVEALDSAGRSVGKTSGYVNGTVPPTDRAYFEVQAPAGGAAYRVTVQSFDLQGGGG